MNKVVVLAGPSGSGKNTIVREIETRFPSVSHLVSTTTRSPRPDEVDGRDYHFVSIEEWDRLVGDGAIVGERFVNMLGGIHYGITRDELRQKLAGHSIVFALVDFSGAQWLKEEYHATTIFLEPESVEELGIRLRARNPEWSGQEFETRMTLMREELTQAPLYDHRVVSAYGSLVAAVDEIVEILKKEGYNPGR
jgi:guanylate kinase